MTNEETPPKREFKYPAGTGPRAGAAASASAPKTSTRPRHTPGRMNKTEEAYSHLLEARRLIGEIKTWKHESMKFRLADHCWYTPDFALWMPSGALEVHETKGHMEDDARVKISVFREMYPLIPLILVRNVKGEWIYE